MTAPPDSSPALPLQCAAQLEGYRTRSNQAQTPEALEHTVQLLNDAGVRSYKAAGVWAETVPNASGVLGTAALALRQATAALTWAPKNQERMQDFEAALRALREAVPSRPVRGAA